MAIRYFICLSYSKVDTILVSHARNQPEIGATVLAGTFITRRPPPRPPSPRRHRVGRGLEQVPVPVETRAATRAGGTGPGAAAPLPRAAVRRGRLGPPAPPYGLPPLHCPGSSRGRAPGRHGADSIGSIGRSTTSVVSGGGVVFSAVSRFSRRGRPPGPPSVAAGSAPSASPPPPSSGGGGDLVWLSISMVGKCEECVAGKSYFGPEGPSYPFTGKEQAP